MKPDTSDVGPAPASLHQCTHTQGKNEEENRNQTLNPASIYCRIVSVSPSVSADLETNALSRSCLSFLIRSNSLAPRLRQFLSGQHFI